MTAPYEPGDWIDGWVVDEVLGLGSAGGVYVVHKEDIPELVCVMKTLVEPEPDVAREFAEIGRKLYAVHHPNVVRIRDIRAYEAPRFMLLDFVEGEPLSEYIRRRGPLSHGRALSFARQLGEAVDAIHKQKIAHCDIRTENLIVSPDGEQITLVDIGTHAHKDAAKLTRTGKIKASLAVYAPPEWMDGKGDPYRWDMYSVGAVIHEMLTGQPPVAPAADTQGQLLQAIAIKRKTPHHDPGKEHPDELREVIRWCTQSNWSARPDDASEIVWALDDFLDRTEINPSSVMPAATRAERPAPEPKPKTRPTLSPAPSFDDFDEQPPTVVEVPKPPTKPAPPPAAAPREVYTPEPEPEPEPETFDDWDSDYPDLDEPGSPAVLIMASAGIGLMGVGLVAIVVAAVVLVPGLRGPSGSTKASAAKVAAPVAAPVPEPVEEPVPLPEPEPELPTGPQIVEDDLPSDYQERKDKKKAYLAIDPPEGVSSVEVFFLRDGEPDASIGKAPFKSSKYERGLRPFFPNLVRGIRVKNTKAGIDETWDPHELQEGKALRWKVQPGE